MSKRTKITGLALALAALPAMAQVTMTGTVQSDWLVPQEDTQMGTGHYDSKVMTNSYAEAHLSSNVLRAGLRLEYLQYPLPGYEKDFKGWGLGMVYLQGRTKHVEFTAGNFYDQFGSGLIFRTYENRSLGVDNSLMGLRALVKPIDGITLKVLGGAQRHYWEYNSGIVSGADLELNMEQWLKGLNQKNMFWTLGVSAVNNYSPVDEENPLVVRTLTETDQLGMPHIYRESLNLPSNVQAYDFRTTFQAGEFSLLGEYAIKSHDPSYDNNYTYQHGNAVLVSGSWSRKGVSGLLQFKRSEDMSYRSDRTVTGTSSTINHMPAFAMQHTYALAALYPYATQMAGGEYAFQTEWSYNIPKKTILGGRYGTMLQLHISHIRGLDDRLYYQDANLQMSHKFSKVFKLNAMYMYQKYNKRVIEGEGDMINSHIIVLDGRFTLSRKVTLRAEAQCLLTQQDQGNWWYGMLEMSLQPHWMITLSDMYNANCPNYLADGSEDGTTSKRHYWQALLTWTQGSHRLQAGYAVTRAGFNCAGGVCRYVPASKGVKVSYAYSF